MDIDYLDSSRSEIFNTLNVNRFLGVISFAPSHFHPFVSSNFISFHPQPPPIHPSLPSNHQQEIKSRNTVCVSPQGHYNSYNMNECTNERKKTKLLHAISLLVLPLHKIYRPVFSLPLTHRISLPSLFLSEEVSLFVSFLLFWLPVFLLR